MIESLAGAFESNLKLKLKVSMAASILALSGAGCAAETGDSTPPEASSPIGEALEAALAKLEGKVDMSACRSVVEYDIDCDGVSDQLDKLPGRADLGDDDGDLVANVFDLHEDNDFLYDSDADGLIDAYDTFNGNNLADSDGDGIYDGQDLQPFVPAVAATYSEQDNREVGNQIVLNSLANASFQKILDTDPYVLPEDTPFTTDFDGDNYNDYFDSEPRNAYITPENDVYEIGSDAWYEDE